VVHQQYIAAGAGAELEQEQKLIDYVAAVAARLAAAVARKSMKLVQCDPLLTLCTCNWL